VYKSTPTVFTTQSKKKPVDFGTWHHRLGHTRANIIHEMASRKLVDGLNIIGQMSLGGLCKDCIYGKHTAHPYNTNVAEREKEVLERVYINI